MNLHRIGGPGARRGVHCTARATGSISVETDGAQSCALRIVVETCRETVCRGDQDCKVLIDYEAASFAAALPTQVAIVTHRCFLGVATSIKILPDAPLQVRIKSSGKFRTEVARQEIEMRKEGTIQKFEISARQDSNPRLRLES